MKYFVCSVYPVGSENRMGRLCSEFPQSLSLSPIGLSFTKRYLFMNVRP